jgi:hypothetical protein
MVPYSPAGGADTTARILYAKLSDDLGRQFNARVRRLMFARDQLSRRRTFARRRRQLFRRSLLATGFRKNPHGDDEERGGEQHEAGKIRSHRRAAPKREPERHENDDNRDSRFDVGWHGAAPYLFLDLA